MTPEPAPEPIPDTEPAIAPPPEPVKEEFRYRAQPARRREPPPSATQSPTSVWTQPAAPQPAPRRPGFIAQVKQAIGVSDEEATARSAVAPSTSPTAAPGTAAARAQPTTTQSAAPAATQPAATQRPSTQPASVRPAATQPSAVRPQATQPASRQPAAVKPAVTQKRRVAPPKPPDEPEYKPGDLICGNCGVGNDPLRRFCRRCGTTLVDAIVAAKPPWYKRIFRRRDRALKAGERPKDMGVAERPGRVSFITRLFRLRRLVLTLLAAAAALGIGAYAFFPDVRGQVDRGISEIRRMFLPELGPIFPIGYSGDAIDEHPAGHAFDEFSNTYWAFDRSTGTPVLSAEFSHPFDLAGIIITSAPKDEYTNFDRPKTIRLEFPGTEAPPVTLQLDDLDAAIIKDGLDARGVETVELHFIDFYPHDEDIEESILAISDLQFRERR